MIGIAISAGFVYLNRANELKRFALSKVIGQVAATTIAGTAKGKQLAINVNGTKTGTYQLSVASNQTINNALIDLLSGKSAKEIVADAVKTDAMIIYRSTGEAEGGATYYFSTEATVTVNFDLVLYSTGTFSAKMMNKSGDTFTISNGSFKVFGKPSLGN